jgi:hypothetical protein
MHGGHSAENRPWGGALSLERYSARRFGMDDQRSAVKTVKKGEARGHGPQCASRVVGELPLGHRRNGIVSFTLEIERPNRAAGSRRILPDHRQYFLLKQ